MDNNMIHIDDLVRQRLRGGEEPERPGAWLTMRELLDKEMPVSAGVNWRRIVGYFTALLLLTTASVGGYRMYSNHVSDADIVSGGGGGRDGEGQYGTASGIAANVPSATTTTSDERVNSTTNQTTATINQTTASNQGNPRAVNTPALTASNKKRAVSSGNLPDRVSDEGAQSLSDAQRPSAATIASIAADASRPQNIAQRAIPTPIVSSSPLYASAGAAAVNGRRLQSAPAKLSAKTVDALQAAPAAASGSIAKLPQPPPAIVRHDTIERIELVYHRVYDAGAQRSYYRIDTFPQGRFVIDRIQPAQQEIAVAETTTPAPKRHGLLRRRMAAKTSGGANVTSLAIKTGTPGTASANDLKLASAPAPVVPAATITAKSPEQEVGGALASLGAAQVNKKHFLLWDAERVNAVINQVKFNLAKVQMYPGVMLGINASMFTPNALGGFQAGLTSLFVLNEWWSLMLEPKYIIRFNTGSSLRDDYKEVIDGSGQIQPDPNYPGYLSYTWTDHTIQHSFNYDQVRTIELPIMLRYHWNQWYMQGGANLVFSSPIDTKEVIQPLNDYKNHGDLRPSLKPEPYITNDHPNVRMSDFGSRFGTGYVISGGYMFSPAVYVDGRITQTFWDNSNTAGARQVSKDLLRTPSIQLSVGYRFGQKH